MKQAILDSVFPDKREITNIRRGLFEGCEMNLTPRHQFHVAYGTYELEVSPHFEQLAIGADHFFDIGAAEGYYSMYMLKHSDAKVYAFEPEREACDQLLANFERNTRDGHRVAFAERLVSDRESNETITVDGVARNLHGAIFMKIDVEGNEAAVLRGAEDVLSRSDTRVIIEVHGHEEEKECLWILDDHGYNVEYVSPAWWRSVVKDGRSGEHNRWLVAERPDGLQR